MCGRLFLLLGPVVMRSVVEGRSLGPSATGFAVPARPAPLGIHASRTSLISTSSTHLGLVHAMGRAVFRVCPSRASVLS